MRIVSFRGTQALGIDDWMNNFCHAVDERVGSNKGQLGQIVVGGVKGQAHFYFMRAVEELFKVCLINLFLFEV